MLRRDYARSPHNGKDERRKLTDPSALTGTSPNLEEEYKQSIVPLS